MSEAAILDAAAALFARSGPAAVSLREVAATAGCTHPLIARYFGGKDDLVGAVAERLAGQVEGVVHRSASSAEPLVDLLAAARAHRAATQLLIRTALGDLPPRHFPACLQVTRLLDGPGWANDAPSGGAGRRARLCAYAAASTIAGFVTFEGFVVAGTGLGRLAPSQRDVAMARVARALLGLVELDEPLLTARDLTSTVTPAAAPPGSRPTAADALLEAAVSLFAERGPAATSVRDVARRARVNQGLIYRHFGSKEALLASALERGVSDLFPAALAGDEFDFDAMSWLLHHRSSGPRLLARTLVDDIDITSVRRRFPVLRRLLRRYDDVPSGAGPADLTDPRVAVSAAAAMALGSAVWGEHLRPVLGLGPRDGVESAIADLARTLVAAPSSGAPALGTSGDRRAR